LLAPIEFRGPLGSRPPHLDSLVARVSAAHSGDEQPKQSWISNPQRALLVLAVTACTTLLVLLYLGDFFR
jgi:hypothetical protein